MPRHRPLQPTQVGPSNKLRRAVWGAVWLLLYRPSPILLHGWRRMLLRAFGAQVGHGAYPYPRARIWAPWNLQMAPFSCLANDVDCYCVAPIRLGAHATVSQYSYLCSASHDYRDPAMPLVSAAIDIGAEAWVAADAFVGPGVTIGRGAVVAARSTVVGDVEPWCVVAGTPARVVRTRPAFERTAEGAVHGPVAGAKTAEAARTPGA